MEKAALAIKMMMRDEYNEYIRDVHNKVKKLVEEAPEGQVGEVFLCYELFMKKEEQK